MLVDSPMIGNKDVIHFEVDFYSRKTNKNSLSLNLKQINDFYLCIGKEYILYKSDYLIYLINPRPLPRPLNNFLFKNVRFFLSNYYIPYENKSEK